MQGKCFKSPESLFFVCLFPKWSAQFSLDHFSQCDLLLSSLKRHCPMLGATLHLWGPTECPLSCICGRTPTVPTCRPNRQVHTIPLHVHPGRGLAYTLQEIFQSSRGMRPDFPHVLVLMTDGRSQDDVRPPARVAHALGKSCPVAFPWDLGSPMISRGLRVVHYVMSALWAGFLHSFILSSLLHPYFCS